MTKIADFQQQLKDQLVFSLQDIYNLWPDFSYRQLNRWQKKGYLKNIKRNFYFFDSQVDCESDLFVVANKIYFPSYVSLEKAFEVYDFIPEGVFQITSITTKKTASFDTCLTRFSYRSLNPRLFWGYRLIEFRQQSFLLAEAEKAILDYLYLKPHLKTVADFQALRFDRESFVENVNLAKLKLYADRFNNRALTGRLENFLGAIADV